LVLAEDKKKLIIGGMLSILIALILVAQAVFAPSTNPSVTPTLVTTPNINATAGYYFNANNFTFLLDGEMPLSAFYYRTHSHGMAYREIEGGHDYLVLDMHGNYPSAVGNEFCVSCYSISRTYLYGNFTWYAYMNETGDGSKDLYFGGLELEHGHPWEGLIAMHYGDMVGATGYYFITSEGGTNETTAMAGFNANNTRTKFQINWYSTYVEAYVNDVLEANHTTRVPNEPMGWIIEVCHWEPGNTPTRDNRIYFDWGSFDYTPHP